MNSKNIQQAISELQAGKLVIIPTETVYGIAVDATNDDALNRLFALKKRSTAKPLTVHVASLDQAKEYAIFDERAEKLAANFWPGALTMVLPRRVDTKVSGLVTAGLDTVGIRLPDHQVALEVLRQVGFPLAISSANLSDNASPTNMHTVIKGASLVLEGEESRIGVASTVVDLNSPFPKILRLGTISEKNILKIIE